MSTLQAVTDSSFDADVLQASQPVLVDYWAEWCGPCRMIMPILEEIAVEFADRVKILKLNVDESAATATKYGVRGIPTLMLFKNGKVLATRAGYLNKTQLSEFINSHL